MSSFEEEFPSLKSASVLIGDKSLGQTGIPVVQETLIELYCLDKQKVKEAMKVCFQKTRGLPAVGVAYELLTKELGLEEE